MPRACFVAGALLAAGAAAFAARRLTRKRPAPRRAAGFRIARPTADLAAISDDYQRGLGLTLLGSFRGHEGFDGDILGDEEGGWQIELVSTPDSEAYAHPTPELQAVFFVASEEEVMQRVERALESGAFRLVRNDNPYWQRWGRTLEDREGFRLVVSV